MPLENWTLPITRIFFFSVTFDKLSGNNCFNLQKIQLKVFISARLRLGLQRRWRSPGFCCPHFHFNTLFLTLPTHKIIGNAYILGVDFRSLLWYPNQKVKKPLSWDFVVFRTCGFKQCEALVAILQLDVATINLITRKSWTPATNVYFSNNSKIK